MSESALAARAVNTPHRKFSLKRELAHYDATEPTAHMDAVRRVIRAHAKAIIEGRRRWPRELIAWKNRREIAYHHANGPANPWEDERNWTRPQRERAMFMDRTHAALMARWDAAIRTGDAVARKAVLQALHEFYEQECPA